jgi:hypothetical protein
VSLGEIVPGDQLATPNVPATVLANPILNQRTTVYNIEVHGEHVYEVGELGVLVHNAADDCFDAMKALMPIRFG